jgi:hypothetical protein
MDRHPSTAASQRRCPICHRGRLVVISFDEPERPQDPDLQQSADSRQIESYSCGHRVVGASLDTADPDQLDVERRGSEETVDPSPEG